MSRIGFASIDVPSGITVSFSNNVVTVKGKSAELVQELKEGFNIKIEDGVLTVERPSDSKEDKSLHGLYRALINNMVEGLDKGFTKELELVGVGYRADRKSVV